MVSVFGHSDEKNIYFWSLQDQEHQFAETEKKTGFTLRKETELFKFTHIRRVLFFKGCNDRGYNFKGLVSFFEVFRSTSVVMCKRPV